MLCMEWRFVLGELVHLSIFYVLFIYCMSVVLESFSCRSLSTVFCQVSFVDVEDSGTAVYGAMRVLVN